MIDNLPCNIIMSSKSEFRQNSLVRHRIEFKGAIWQENLPGAPETGDQNKSGTPNPPEPEDDSSFSNQFKQRKLKRKADAPLVNSEPQIQNGTSTQSPSIPSLPIDSKLQLDPDGVNSTLSERKSRPKVQITIQGIRVDPSLMHKRLRK